MLSRIELEEMSYTDLKDLVRASELTIPKHASQEDLVVLMLDLYAQRKEEIMAQNQDEPVKTEPVKAKQAKKYGEYDSKQEYVKAMLEPVLCIITPQAPEFSRQTLSTASISVGNDLIPNREFAFVADGNTVTSVPRMALNRIKEMRILLRGTTNLNKSTMSGNLQGSGFGRRFSVHILDEQEIADYAAKKVEKAQAATGVGL